MFRWVAIEGLMGAGKTTTTQLVGAKAEAAVVLDRANLHPFLDAYYREPRRFALETELVFMGIHSHQVKQIPSRGLFVSDFSPAKDLIFGGLNLTDSDLEFLRDVDRHLWEGLPNPSLSVFLDVPPYVCLERVQQRGRPTERSLTVGYLERLRDTYLAGFSALGERVVKVELSGRESRNEVADRVFEQIGTI
jgi:deoxyguanosine kinase